MAQASVMTNPPAVKACILGESGAGKSSLVLLQTTGEFHGNQPTTIGAAYLTWIPRNRRCKLEVWDTAGQERYNSLAPMYYRNARGVIIVYDVTERNSFERAQTWLNEVLSAAGPRDFDPIVVLVGNKIDLEDARTVTREEGEQMAASMECSYFETSAKKNIGVAEIFEHIAQTVPLEDTRRAAHQDIVIDQLPSAKSSGCC